jgi:uncharacterized protein YlxW (UPF0749 family)
MMNRCLIPLVLLAAVAATEVTPIDKVITLLEGMKSDVVKEGKAEASSYNQFACFCKTTTTTKSSAIKTGNDNIDSLSADIADKTQSKKTDSTEYSERSAKQESLAADLQKTNARCAEEKAKYEAEEADMSKALSSMKSAIKAMKDTGGSASLLQSSSAHADVLQTIAMAEAMGMVAQPKQKALVSMLQADPSRHEGAAYHEGSQDIIDLLVEIQGDFKDAKKTLDDEYKKSKKACDEMKASLKKEMGSNTDAMKALDKNIAKLAKEIAAHRADLVDEEGDMKDNEQYLNDLTARCEARANDYDQRSNMRNDEITALSQALTILKGDVKTASDDVNKRALLQELRKFQAKPAAAAKQTVKETVEASTPKASAPKESKPEAKAIKAVTFLQVRSSEEDRKTHALALLSSEGDRLSSFVLTSLAQRSAGDPFKKIKGLIQKLIERLLAESAAEATKKGFCDTELGKARKERDFRREDTQDLSSELEGLEAKEDALTEEIKVLTKQIADESLALKETTSDRKIEKEDNIKTLETARGGLAAVQEALMTLRSFYSQAAKAAFVQASPVDEDTSGAGFSGNYQGNQSGSKAVLSLLETIESDFDRTIRTTETAEATAAADFVKFVQATKSSIASKTTKKDLDEQDLKSTKTSLKSKMNDLITAQSLLDDALRELEELKPTCIDTGMSYSQRVAKREEEMAALKKALCILDTDKVESECKL